MVRAYWERIDGPGSTGGTTVTVQILDVVLFSHDGRRRSLPLKPGQVSIITGGSKTGKSALIDIVDYCFCSGECRVPEGPIRRSVSWYGLRLQLASGQAFVARRCPSPRAASSEDCYVDIGDEVRLPDADELRQTTNTTGLGALLNGWCGIHDNLHVPPAGQVRQALSANFRHALAFCFQPQDEIIRRHQLFHGADDHWFAQAMTDTLPYFLGAVDDDYVRNREQLRRLREQLRAVDRRLNELKALRGGGLTKAAALLAEARDAGLSGTVTDSWEDTVAALAEVERMPIAAVDVQTPGGQEYGRLTEERTNLLLSQRQLRDQIEEARAFEHDGTGFSKEASEQRARLVSVGIFDGHLAGRSCPLCSRELPLDALPDASQLHSLEADLGSRLDSVVQAAPQVEKAIAQLESSLGRVQASLADNRQQMEAVRAESDRVQQSQDEAAKQAHMLGRISLYLESLPELPDTKALEEQGEQLRAACSILEESLSDERISERIDSIASILGRRLTGWAHDLELEHSRFPLRLDIRNLTIVADTNDGPVPMGRMGSGENWVGYHLIAHLALHEWFTQRARPVPRFLFLDQPSQVYFPPEKRDSEGSMAMVDEEDRRAVVRMFEFVFEIVGELAPGFQVVVTEHADIDEDWYQRAVVERWRGGLKLVPEDWPRLG